MLILLETLLKGNRENVGGNLNYIEFEAPNQVSFLNSKKIGAKDAAIMTSEQFQTTLFLYVSGKL